MRYKKIAVLTSKESWFLSYAKEFVAFLRKKNNIRATLFFNHKKISDDYEVIFILSYFEIVDNKFLSRHKHNLVVHESNLPEGRGWAPLFWQILEGKNKIPIVLFAATEKIDTGDIYLKDSIVYKGHELHAEIREKQAKKTVELCLKFLSEYKALKPEKQKGKPTFYKRRGPADSELNINKTLKKQFNLLRTVSNENFPAFFCHKGHKYIVKIYKSRIEE